MDEDFYKQRAREVRDIAATADPFIKQRLLDLADRYDDKRKTMITSLPSAPTIATTRRAIVKAIPASNSRTVSPGTRQNTVNRDQALSATEQTGNQLVSPKRLLRACENENQSALRLLWPIQNTSAHKREHDWH